MMKRIKLAYGHDAATFEREIVRVVRSYASYVNLLPATADNYFAEPGGLFRLGLETGFYALQGTDAQIFEGRATITARLRLEPRWRLATFIAGLCNEVHRTLSHLTARDAKGRSWPAYLLGLTPWMEEHGADRLFPRWDPGSQESRAIGVFALPLIVDRATMQHLATDNAVVVPYMMAAISGTALYREHNIIDELVRRATAMVVDRNLRGNIDRYGKLPLGAHLERYLVDAMRRLAASNHQWQPNQRQSRVWCGRDGMYLVWPRAVQDVIELLESEQLPGMPKVPETLLEILLDAKVFEPRDNASSTWVIHLPGGNINYEAVKLVSPDVLLTSFATTVAGLDHVLAVDDPALRSQQPPASGPAGGPAQAGDPQLQLLPAAASEAARLKPGSTSPAGVGHNGQQGSPQASVEPATHAAAPPVRTRFVFIPSLRLHKSIVDPLADIVDSLNDRNARYARTVRTGLFIPIRELLRRGLDPQMVQRELDGACMLAKAGSGERTQVHEFDGDEIPGVVLLPGFIKGFNVDDFAPPDCQ